MKNVINHNSKNYYIGTLLLSIISATTYSVQEYNLIPNILHNRININVLFILIGNTIGLLVISLFIGTIICSIKYLFKKKWKNFAKTLFYTNLVINSWLLFITFST